MKKVIMKRKVAILMKKVLQKKPNKKRAKIKKKRAQMTKIWKVVVKIKIRKKTKMNQL